MLRHLVPLMLSAILAAPAAEVVLGEGWSEHRSPGAAGSSVFAPGGVTLGVERGRFARIECTLGLDGTDAAPLRIQCAISATGDQPLRNEPALMTVAWKNALFAVGITAGNRHDERRPIARWIVDGKAGEALSDLELYPDQCPSHVRILVAERDISAWVSRDGWTWQRLATLARGTAFAGPAASVALGKGWPQAGLSLDRDVQADARQPAVLSFTNFLATDVAPLVPASLLKTYQKAPSRDDALEALQTASLPRQWWLSGPFPDQRGKADLPATTPFDAKGVFDLGDKKLGWIEHRIGDSPNDRIVVVSDLIKGGGRAVRYAATTVVCDQPRLERFLFDGGQHISLFVNGHPVVVDRRERNEQVNPDRLAALVNLNAGSNAIVIRLVGDEHGRSAFTFRHEAGDPRARIALLRRLALDFPEDSEALAAGHLEIARRWEGLGFLREAAGALDELLKIEDAAPEVIETGLMERARLHAALRDEAAAAGDIEVLAKHWAKQSDDQLAARRKTANLWLRMGLPVKALAALAEAAAVPDITLENRLQLGLERLRLLTRGADTAGVIAELRALAAALPASDARRGDLLAEALVRAPAAGAAADFTALAAVPGQRAQRRLAGLLAARGDRAGSLSAFKAIAGLPAAGVLDAPAVIHAEALAAAGDASAAATAYRSAFAALGVQPPAGDLNVLRTAFVRACIAETPAGAKLLQDSKVVPAASGERLMLSDLRRWSVIGPFSNENWRCYDKPPVRADAVDTGKPVEGKAWQVPGADAYEGGILDLAELLKQDNCVAFCYAEIASASSGMGTLSMGADDGLVVWVNGKKVHEDREHRGVQPDSIKVQVPLDQGVNRILAMVQQGNGGWGLQARLLTPGWLEADVGRMLRFLADKPAQRADIAAALLGLSDTLARNGQVAAGDALARTVLRAFPDCWDAQQAALARWLDEDQNQGAARDALLWFEANLPLHPGTSEDAERQTDLRLKAVERLMQTGEISAAAEIIDGVLWSAFDDRTQARALRAQGDLFVAAGYSRRGAEAYAQALLLPGIDEGLERQLRQGVAHQAHSRRPRAEVASVSFQVTTALRGAERAAEAGDLDFAIPAFQKEIEADRGQVVAISGGRLVGVAGWCAERLRALGDAGIQAYRARYDATVSDQVARAVASDDVDACERIAATWPVATAADEALASAARGYLDRGAWALAAATVEMLPDAALAVRTPLVAAAVRAAALAGDRAAHTRLAARFAALGVPTTLAGKTIDARAWSAEQAGLLLPDRAVVWPVGAQAVVPFTIPAATLRDVRRFVGEGARTVHPACLAAIAGEVAFIDTGSEALAVELGSGQVRWRQASPASVGDDRFRGLSSTQPALCGSVVVGRASAGGRRVLAARQRSDGALAWTAAPVGLDAVSSPVSDGARVIGLFAAAGQVVLASFTATGEPVWTTSLPVPRASLGASIDLGGEMAAPTVVGREVYVATDAGAVIALDAGSGRVRWLGHYPSAMLGDEQGATQVHLLARAPGRVVASGSRIAVLPRDSLGLFCFERADGAPAWSREFVAARALAAGEASGALVLQGAAVECIDAGTGTTRWRWRPRDGVPIGLAAVDAGSVAVASASTLYRLGLGDGRESAATTWRELGVTGSAPGALHWAGDRLVAVGNGGVAVLGAGKPATGLPALVPATAVIRNQKLAELPIAAGEGCAVRWWLPGDAVLALERPSDSTAGECYVVGERSLTRLDAATATVVWRSALPAGSQVIDWSADGILVRMHGAMAMLARADGAMQWLSPLEENVARALVDDEQPEVVLAAGTVLVYRGHWNRRVELRDARTGRLLRGIEVPDARLIAVTVHEGQVHLLYQRKDSLWVDIRALADDTLVATKDLGQRGDDTGGKVLPGGRCVLLFGRCSGYYDAAARTITAAPMPLEDTVGAWNEDGVRVHVIGAVDQKWSLVVIDPAKPAIEFSEYFTHGWAPNADHMRPLAWRSAPGGRWLRIERDRHGKNGVVCRGADGKEAWFLTGVESSRRRYSALAVLGQNAIELYPEGGTMIARTIALADGKVLATSPVPGGETDRPMPLLTISDRLLYGTPGGLIALGVGKLPAATADAPAGERELRDLATAAGETRHAIPLLASAPVIDGQLADWPAEPKPIILGPGAGRPRRDGLAPSGEPRLRFGWDATGLYLAVEAVASGWHPPTAAGAVGDALLVAIDPLDDQVRQPLLFSLALVDGRPRVTLVEGTVPGDLGPADQPRLRVAAGAAGATYELVVPWPLLRKKAEQRPGDHRHLRLGVAALSADGAAREWGHGIVRGFAPVLLRSVELRK